MRKKQKKEVMIFSTDNRQFSDFLPVSSKRDELFLRIKITFIWGGGLKIAQQFHMLVKFWLILGEKGANSQKPFKRASYTLIDIL